MLGFHSLTLYQWPFFSEKQQLLDGLCIVIHPARKIKMANCRIFWAQISVFAGACRTSVEIVISHLHPAVHWVAILEKGVHCAICTRPIPQLKAPSNFLKKVSWPPACEHKIKEQMAARRRICSLPKLN